MARPDGVNVTRSSESVTLRGGVLVTGWEASKMARATSSESLVNVASGVTVVIFPFSRTKRGGERRDWGPYLGDT